MISSAPVASDIPQFVSFPEGLSGEGASDDRYPVLTDGNFVPALHTEMLKNDGWATPELCKAVQFAWGVLLREYASRPAFTGEYWAVGG